MPLYDQFFTRPEVAALCWKYVAAIVPALTGKSPQELAFIEPAAGYGAFYDLLPSLVGSGWIFNRVTLESSSMTS